MKKIRFKSLSLKGVLFYFALAGSMILLNFTLPLHEPLSFALLFAALMNGANPFLATGAFLLATLPLFNLSIFLSCAIQGAFLLIIFAFYRAFRRTAGWEKIAYVTLAQLPFLFLFPHEGYAVFPFAILGQKAILAGGLVLFSLLFERAQNALCERAFQSKLPANERVLLALLWLCVGLGALNAVGKLPYLFVAFSALLCAVFLLKNSSAFPIAVVLALPLCVFRASLLPVAQFTLYTCVCLGTLSYGKIIASLALSLAYLAVCYFEGVYSLDGATLALNLLACLLPAFILSCVPNKAYRRLENALLFYRERVLPRVAVNRNRRSIGEQLYEVSALFRAIERAFAFEESSPEQMQERIVTKLFSCVCASCPDCTKCEHSGVLDELPKLITVGTAKGRVNLIDLPSALSAHCSNTAGILFALNKLLAEYARVQTEMATAREGRQLLARQARGVSDVLRNIALEQSEEYAFYDEEEKLAHALATEGLNSSEIFLYGEEANFTANITLDHAASGQKVCEIAGEALGFPLALAEKIPLTEKKSCFVLHKKPNYDASFGIAGTPKKGESASGDTHSILKIDERRFLVALADGMGSGENARSVSDNTLSLVESFYKAKMPSSTVLDTVNKLVAFSSEERFSCLDLAAVNLDTGYADVVKIGSPVGFVLSGEELRVLEGESLPMGALEAVHPATMRVELHENDFLLFMSDGITSAFGSPTDLCAYLSALRPLNPQSLAEEILHSALSRNHERAEDDMTVLAVKLTKSA